MTKVIQAADLFCGGGGFTTGLLLACEDLGYDLNLVAINHWDKAIATHVRNHGYALHYCEDVALIHPKEAVPDGYLDILIAGLRCTHHSRALGGKPRNEQMRSDAWHVLRWAEDLYINTIILENVAEFMEWGPLDEKGKPIPHLKGKLFVAFLESLKALDYTVDFRLLSCANYGDPTSRERLFIVAHRGGTAIRWPEPTHSATGGSDLVRNTQPWRTAREIIDFGLPSQSIFGRKKPLAPNTMRRIFAGLRRFSGLDLEPYLVPFYSERDGQQPRTHSVDEPLPTVTTGPRFGVAQPFLMTMEHARRAEPFVVATNHGDDTRRCYSIDEPMKTLTTVDAWGVVQPYLVKYYGCGEGVASIDEPLDTVTTKEKFDLVIPVGNGMQALVDIRFRMLQPEEYARAHSFPEGYEFAGNREEVVKQIGNSVPVETSRALCRVQLEAAKQRFL